MDQVYFYLMDGDEHICYWRGHMTDFTNRNPKFQWFSFNIDKYYGKVKNDYDAGMVQIKMAINDLEKESPVDWRRFQAWKDPPNIRLNACKIRCYIYQCRNLEAADSDGTSDPYVKVHGIVDANEMTMQVYRTPTVTDNLNPIFYSTIDIVFAYSEKEALPPIVMDIYDSDKGESLMGMMDGNDDFLARAIINLKDASIADYRK